MGSAGSDRISHSCDGVLPQPLHVLGQGARAAHLFRDGQSRADRRFPARDRPVVTTPTGRRERWLAHLAMLLFSALIAGSFTTGAMAVPNIHPLPLNAVRFLLAAAVKGAVA